MSKSYEKKKVFRRMIKQLANKGLINAADGKMITRNAGALNSMMRHYMPNR